MAISPPTATATAQPSANDATTAAADDVIVDGGEQEQWQWDREVFRCRRHRAVRSHAVRAEKAARTAARHVRGGHRAGNKNRTALRPARGDVAAHRDVRPRCPGARERAWSLKAALAPIHDCDVTRCRTAAFPVDGADLWPEPCQSRMNVFRLTAMLLYRRSKPVDTPLVFSSSRAWQRPSRALPGEADEGCPPTRLMVAMAQPTDAATLAALLQQDGVDVNALPERGEVVAPAMVWQTMEWHPAFDAAGAGYMFFRDHVPLGEEEDDDVAMAGVPPPLLSVLFASDDGAVERCAALLAVPTLRVNVPRLLRMVALTGSAYGGPRLRANPYPVAANAVLVDMVRAEMARREAVAAASSDASLGVPVACAVACGAPAVQCSASASAVSTTAVASPTPGGSESATGCRPRPMFRKTRVYV